MNQNVLCVVDLASPATSGAVLQRAGALATLDNARLTVLTVAPDFGVSFWAEMMDAGPAKAMLEQANRMLEEFVAKTLPGVKAARYLVAYGDPVGKIPEVIEETAADLAVLGASHAEIAAALARGAGCSVYLVR